MDELPGRVEAALSAAADASPNNPRKTMASVRKGEAREERLPSRKSETDAEGVGWKSMIVIRALKSLPTERREGFASLCFHKAAGGRRAISEGPARCARREFSSSQVELPEKSDKMFTKCGYRDYVVEQSWTGRGYGKAFVNDQMTGFGKAVALESRNEISSVIEAAMSGSGISARHSNSSLPLVEVQMTAWPANKAEAKSSRPSTISHRGGKVPAPQDLDPPALAT